MLRSLPDHPDWVFDQIAQIGADRSPREACGILLPSPHDGEYIIEVPNESEHPEDSFSFRPEVALQLIENWVVSAPPQDLFRMTIWHTHPSGGVGPSTTDMRNRQNDAFHLVVTLTDFGDYKVTWY